MKPKPRNEHDEALKREFIAKKGITVCPPPGHLPEPPVAPAVVQTVRPQKPMPTPPSKEEMGTKPNLAWIPVDNLFVDDHYQRAVSTSRGQSIIREIVAGFRWQLFSVLLVTPREEGGYWVIDGQHRMTAARHAGIREVPAMVLSDLTQQEQAKTFTAINTRRVTMTAQAIYHARVAAGDAEALALQECLARADVVIPRYPKAASINLLPNETMLVTRLLVALKKHGPDILVQALQSIRHSYPTKSGYLNKDIFDERLGRAVSRKMRMEENLLSDRL